MASKRKAAKATAGDGLPQKRARTNEAAKPKTQVQQGSTLHQQDGQRQIEIRQQIPKKEASSTPRRGQAVQQDLLARYYTRVETLRAYLLKELPATSRLRRKKLTYVGKQDHSTAVEKLLDHVLETTLVACSNKDSNGPDTKRASEEHEREQKRITFSQTRRADESYVTISSAAEGAFSPQSEIVDFVIWLIFERTPRTEGYKEYSNVICHGFKRGRPAADSKQACTIPDLYIARNPQNAVTLKEAPWPQLLAILGAQAEKIMTNLLLDCSLFLAVEAGDGNYVQLTGKPLFNAISDAGLDKPTLQAHKAVAKPRSLTDITFSRTRMFYANTSFTKAGKISFGLKSKHVLNKFPYSKDQDEIQKDKLNKVGTVRTAMHMFPRQFGLQNVFMPPAGNEKVALSLHNFVVREKEIVTKFGKENLEVSSFKISVPKRLRGAALGLVEKMRLLHKKCNYSALLARYCPEREQIDDVQEEEKENAGSIPPIVSKEANTTLGDKDQSLSSTNEKPRVTKSPPRPKSSVPLIDLATPVWQVSAFCQAVFQNIVPDDFWGTGDIQAHNKAEILKKVDSFVRLQRYEKLTLHTLLQGLKIAEIQWLAPPRLKYCKLSKTDLDKRQEMFAEFIYFLFEFLLIPLLATNFYVTESSVHRNKLFYFRHDVWRRISQPEMAAIKASRLEELKLKDAAATLENRRLGLGKLRLLPKNTTVRPITNLRHRAPGQGKSKYSASINTVLRPVAAMFNFEMKDRPGLLGSGMLSTRGMYSRLKDFKQRMVAKDKTVFYFAKVDVKSAFDTIPQEAMVELLRDVANHSEYHMDQHVEIAASEHNILSKTAPGSKPNNGLGPRKTWKTSARPSDDPSGFQNSVEATMARNRRNTVFVEKACPRTYDRTDHAEYLAGLAATHIRENIVQIGKKYYRQREGIPQGSVLSSTLCSFFYADLEKKELGFLRTTDGDSLLLRLIDDFLLITVDRSKAVRFIEAMQRGHPHYGVSVNPSKSLVNFDLQIDGKTVPKLAEGLPFPYCGTAIDCTTLDLARDRSSKAQNLFNSVTVDHTRSQGYQFQRRVLNYFQIQSHHMFFDTAYNSRQTTLRNLHSAFAETASKMWAYARCMPKGKRPSGRLTIRTIEEVGEMAFGVLNSKMRVQLWPEYKFDVSKPHLRYLLLHAFTAVLGKKQTGYKEVLAYLREEMQQLQTRRSMRLSPNDFMP